MVLDLKRPGCEHAEYVHHPFAAVVGWYAFTARSKGGDAVDDETKRDLPNVRENMKLVRHSSFFENDQLVERASDVTFPTEFAKHLKTALEYVSERLRASREDE